MTNQVATVEQVPVLVPQQGFLALVEKVLDKETPDLSLVEKMLDMQERILAKEAEMQFNSDFALMTGELPVIIKNKRGHNGKYASLDEINQNISKVLQKYGFAISFDVKQQDKHVIVTCFLRHKSGHKEDTTVTIPYDTSGSKNTAQSVGSAITYAKRYALCAILNISLEDDDDDAQATQPQRQQPQQQPQQGFPKPRPTEQAFSNMCVAMTQGSTTIEEIDARYTLNQNQRNHLLSLRAKK